MLIETFSILFGRDVSRLSQQINAYADEDTLWAVVPGIHNSAGNLCLHLIGNLNSYIGATLGGTGYVRDRAAEFSTNGVPKRVLLARLDQTKAMINNTLSSAFMPDSRLSDFYPDEVLGYPMTIHYFLTHLSGHLTYHLGQIDYHRRLLTNGSAIPYVT